MKIALIMPAVLAASIPLAPVAYADPGQAGLSRSFAEAGGPFIGSWAAHGESVTVNSDGSGVEKSRRERRTSHWAACKVRRRGTPPTGTSPAASFSGARS